MGVWRGQLAVLRTATSALGGGPRQQRTRGVGAVPVHGDVTTSSKAVVAADDTNQIVAISAAAVTLLGYDAAEELVGRRLVAILPPRFQQAHIAGFTLHTLVGRAPLLDREVVVPALRRDGTEVDVRLSVTAHDTADGPRSFVATLLPVT
jgi:PAS domain S-box-containing protein